MLCRILASVWSWRNVQVFTEEKINYKFTALRKTTIFIVALFIFGITSSSSNKTQTPQQQAPQSQVSEEKKVEAEQESQNKEVIAPINQDQEVQNQDVPQTQSQEQAQESKKLYSVSNVVDGDTLAVNIDGKQEVLRLIGINTPETVDPRKPVECFGAEASAKAKEILTGKQVSLEADKTQSERDKYGRLLRYVYLEDGTNFNKSMIEQGYAYEYTYNTPYKYQADFKAAQQQSKDNKMGLWAENTCNGNLTKATVTTPTSTPTSKQVSDNPATTSTITPKTSSGSFACSGKHLCGEMASCDEAYFYLNKCGVTSLDRDRDGIPCETICN